MGRKGKTTRMKRKPAPRFWPIHRKEEVWVMKPSSGPHSLENCLPLTLVLRDMLGVAETRREARRIIWQDGVFINGKLQRRDDFPVGLMDVISIPTANQYYRIVPSHKGLFLSPISKEDAGYKLCRVEDKSNVPGGVQLHLHDGSNLIVKVADLKNHVEDVYHTFDVLKLSLPDKEVLECLSLKEGNYAVITGGKNIGVQGKIVELEKAEAKKRRSFLVVVEDEKGTRYQTILDFVFSLGTVQPLVTTASEEEEAVV
jgi:small subunit ribosomal protein S4e